MKELRKPMTQYFKLSDDAIQTIKKPMIETLELLIELDETGKQPGEFPINQLTTMRFETRGEQIVPQSPGVVLSTPPELKLLFSTGFIAHLSQLMNYCLLTQTNINDVMRQMRFSINHSSQCFDLTTEYLEWFRDVINNRNELGTAGLKKAMTEAAVSQVESITVKRITDEKN